jgi:hypothetical protein
MAEIDMIDDAYWLKFAKDHVTSAITTRDDAANKLDGFLTVVWGLYTTAFTTAILLGAVTDSQMLRLIMALPVIIIPIAKFLCIQVQLPVSVNFFPNIPSSIEQQGYATIIRRKNAYMKLATIVSFLSALSIGLALFVFKMNDSKKPIDYYVNVAYCKECKNIRIAGISQPNQILTLSIVGTDSSGKTWYYSEINKVKSNSKGNFDTIVETNAAVKNWKIFVNWTDDKKITRTFEGPQQ